MVYCSTVFLVIAAEAVQYQQKELQPATRDIKNTIPINCKLNQHLVISLQMNVILNMSLALILLVSQDMKCPNNAKGPPLPSSEAQLKSYGS